MEGVKKWLSERTAKKNGIYVHYSPPRVVGVVSGAQLRQWARGGPDSKLERLVLAGQGRRLLAEAEALPLSHHLPALVAKCDALHAAVEKGSLLELQDLLEADYNRNKFVMCRDEAGVSLLHKAVFYDFMDIAEYLIRNYPQLVHARDSEGRTPLHYVAVCRDPACLSSLLEGAGAVRGARDAAGHPPAHYRGPARTQLTLPAVDDMPRENRNPGLVIKRHNIRIWCHDCDMSRLQRVVWEGHGARLLSEVSSQPVVRKFLEAVPYIMNTIRDMHVAVVENNLEGMMKHSGDPVPPLALSSRDANNMTVMHKAAGLGHSSILKYIAERYPQGVNDIDNDGRTPLHYAAAMRDDQHTYNTLVELGADESIVDNKNRTAAFYVNRPHDIDKSLFKTIPDAPRTPSSAYPSSWDWKLLDTEVIAELNKKSKRRHFRASTENISSKNNTNSVSESTESRTVGAMKASNTHELIKDLPELDEINKAENGLDELKESNEINKESEDVEENAEDEALKPNEETGENEETTENEEPPENDLQETFKDIKDGEEEEKVESHEDTGNDNETTDEAAIETSSKDDGQTEDAKDITTENGEETVEKNNINDVGTEERADHETSRQETDTKVNEIGDNETSDEPENKEASEETSKETIKNDEETHSHNTDISQEENPNDLESNNHGEDDHNNIHEELNIHDNSNGEGHHTEEHEGNNESSENSEDDDDVQVPGDTLSEYSDTNLKSTADVSTMGSANIGSESNGRYTQESLIKGIVSGQAEQDSQDASISLRDESVHGEVLILDNDTDTEVTDLINTANMEMLATLVLNGEGSRLIGRQSRNSELQGFLDNVASYMQKINMVHQAAREGNIPAMQAALDRRKFAIARDQTSPNGATPMHVATVFGKTNVIKYLGSKFPETLSAVDFEGRTALHYAASLPDNGHYYNLLQQLGANSKDLDDIGRSAENYRKNQSLLPFHQLLTDFGISKEAAEVMYSDKGPPDPDTGHMDIPIFHTEEGRYLAQSLGDPLIKGLTEVANVKPKDPIAFLASFLHNFPEKEKPQIGTQESRVVIAQEAPEVENEQAAAPVPIESVTKLPRSATRTAILPHKPIDVVTLDPQPLTTPDGPETAFSSAKRDEHGQSMLHFAAARTHSRNALFQLLQESDVSIGYRDELYRTARDVSTQANVPENTKEIDRYVLHLAARGNTEKLAELLMEGYDHILDVVDEDGASITDVISERGDAEVIGMLSSIPSFEEKRDVLHSAVRQGDVAAVEQALWSDGGRKLICCQNSFSRTALHIAVLAQHEDIVAFLVQNVPELLRIGDNLERTPLHYAMGVEKIESLSRILIRAGAKRVLKDLKGRQPSYYFMNKSEILRLQEEEETY